MIRKILLVLVGYLLIRFVIGIWKFRKVLKKGMREMNSNRDQDIPDGEMRVTDKAKKQQNRKNNDGSYVDYEEVE